MPIKFRCTHCKQFLGISREKAGAVVDCPTCGRSIRVPELDGRIAPVPEPRLVVDDPRLNEALDELAQLAAAATAPASSPDRLQQATRLPDDRVPEADDARRSADAHANDSGDRDEPHDTPHAQLEQSPAVLLPVSEPGVSEPNRGREPLDQIEPPSEPEPHPASGSADPLTVLADAADSLTEPEQQADRAPSAVDRAVDRASEVDLPTRWVANPAAEEIPTPLPAPEDELEPPAAVPVPRAEPVAAFARGSNSDAEPVHDPFAELASLDVELPSDAVAGPLSAGAAGRDKSGNLWWIVVVAAGLAFATGWLIGRMERADDGADVALSATSGNEADGDRNADSKRSGGPQRVPAAASDEEEFATVHGQVLVPRSEGSPQPDSSARVLLVPHKRQGSLRLPPGGILSAHSHADYAIVAEGLRLMGGAMVRTDADGRFAVRAEVAGNYWLVIVSQVEPLDDPRKLEPQALAALETCFEAPAKLLGQRRHHAVPVQLELNQVVELVCRLGTPAEHDTVSGR